ncbi:MAG: hypothetical protein E3J64_04230 [Anaerolineales bacterium]|nr:MAG: hypothetical protein E3J64_04230 [Anaerolineales bacterium]
MTTFSAWLRKALGSGGEGFSPAVPSRAKKVGNPPSSSEMLPKTGREPPRAEPHVQAMAYLGKVRAKLNQLAEDFNAGTINRSQFQSLYSHYQQEIRTIEGLIETAPASDSWKGAVTEGKSMLIRRKHAAKAQGYAIYENDSGMPLCTLGRFELDPALVVPMLSSYRAAAEEIFGAGMRSTEIEGGRWLCFVPGECTTMLAVFTTEPAARQLEFLEELHRVFERANQRLLTEPPVEPSSLLFPHEYFLGEWRR